MSFDEHPAEGSKWDIHYHDHSTEHKVRVIAHCKHCARCRFERKNTDCVVLAVAPVADEQPDGDIHGDEKLLVDATMKMTVHAAHCNAMLVAALEGIEVPSVDFWIGRQPAEIRALTSAICTKAKMANELEQQIDACRPYLKEGETVAGCIARNRMDIDRLMGFLAAEKTARENLQSDAARYRWLRTNRLWLQANIPAMLHAGEFDAEIDKARAAHEVAG